jgi:hypothetical protein
MTRVQRLVAGGAIALTLTIIGCGPGAAPAGQSPLTAFTSQTVLEPIRQPFNAASDQMRVVLLLSPT